MKSDQILDSLVIVQSCGEPVSTSPDCTLDIVIRPQSVEGAPLTFRRASCSWLPVWDRLLRLARKTQWLKILVQRTSGIRRSASVAKIQNLQHANAVERDRDNVANANRLAGRIDARAVDAHLARGGERSRRGPRAHHARVP